MLFHLELKGKGYAAARVGFAESDSPVGPFRFIRSLRPNAGKWPTDFSRRDIRKAKKLKEADYKEWWTPGGVRRFVRVCFWRATYRADR